MKRSSPPVLLTTRSYNVASEAVLITVFKMSPDKVTVCELGVNVPDVRVQFPCMVSPAANDNVPPSISRSPVAVLLAFKFTVPELIFI